MTGTYSTSDGKSGSFGSDLSRTASGVIKNQSLTNQDGKTWKRGILRTRDGNTVSRDITVTNPQGETRSHTQSVALD